MKKNHILLQIDTGYLSWNMAACLEEDARATVSDTGRIQNNTALRRGRGVHFADTVLKCKRWLWMRSAGMRDWVTPDGPGGSPSQMDLDLTPGRTY